MVWTHNPKRKSGWRIPTKSKHEGAMGGHSAGHEDERFSWWLSGKGDVGSVPRLGGSLVVGNGNPLPSSCLGNPRTGGLQSMGLQRNQTQLTD